MRRFARSTGLAWELALGGAGRSTTRGAGCARSSRGTRRCCGRRRRRARRQWPTRFANECSARRTSGAAAKIRVAPLAGGYERDAIRPHVLGRFEDMVTASAQHPAMLLYLDNFQSIGPQSRGARAGRRDRRNQRGLNENYARELLELHTLGVNGGYSQLDVQARPNADGLDR